MLATVLTAARERNISESRLFVFDAVDDVDYGSHRSEDVLLQHSESDRMALDDQKNAETTASSLYSTSGTNCWASQGCHDPLPFHQSPLLRFTIVGTPNILYDETGQLNIGGYLLTKIQASQLVTPLFSCSRRPVGNRLSLSRAIPRMYVA